MDKVILPVLFGSGVTTRGFLDLLSTLRSEVSESIERSCIRRNEILFKDIKIAKCIHDNQQLSDFSCFFDSISLRKDHGRTLFETLITRELSLSTTCDRICRINEKFRHFIFCYSAIDNGIRRINSFPKPNPKAF